MSSRKIRYRKSDGTIVTEKFSFNKNKKYKFNKSTGAVEEVALDAVIAEDEITLPGSKSSLRRIADLERNVSILASKSGVVGSSNADTDSMLLTGTQEVSGAKTFTSTVTLKGTTPELHFNGTVDAGVDFAIKATPEGLDFYEPEDGNKLHFQILDDAGVNAVYGYKWNGQSLDNRYQAKGSYQAAGDYVGGGEYHNFGTIVIGSTVTTTAALITDLTNKGFFSHNHSVGKCSWSYAGNGDLTDTGFGTFELAGCVIETFKDGSNKTVRITRPNTGADGASVLVYNDQGSSYAPGWREMVTSHGGNTNITGNLTASGDITAYSDDSLKTNVQTIDGALDRVEAVRGVTFDRINDGTTSVGVIAQELEQVLPEAVHTDANGIRHVAYGNITGLLIEAVKELSAEVKELKKNK